jgi:hypothetical protein
MRKRKQLEHVVFKIGMVYILKTTEEINILTCTYAYLLKKRTRVSTI